jgi:hypothetical protein
MALPLAQQQPIFAADGGMPSTFEARCCFPLVVRARGLFMVAFCDQGHIPEFLLAAQLQQHKWGHIMRKLIALAALPILIGTLSSAVAASGNTSPNGPGSGASSTSQGCRWTATGYGTMRCMTPAQAAYARHKKAAIQSNNQQKRIDEQTRAADAAKSSADAAKERRKQALDNIQRLLDAQRKVSPRI